MTRKQQQIRRESISLLRLPLHAGPVNRQARPAVSDASVGLHRPPQLGGVAFLPRDNRSLHQQRNSEQVQMPSSLARGIPSLIFAWPHRAEHTADDSTPTLRLGEEEGEKMPPRPSLRLIGQTAARPALPRRAQSPRFRTGYATLAPARATTPARLPIHPSFFLVHLGGISLASCLIPVIGARRRSISSQAAQDSNTPTAEEGEASATDHPPAEDPPFPFIYPVQQPFPPLHQRRRLAAQLRHQIETAPLDAAFNLRQLRLVTEEPQIHLPAPDAPPSPYTQLSNLRPVPWVWRFPATLALHSILRLVRGEIAAASTPRPADARAKDALLPLAITIAQHSLRFDALMWNATLRGQHQQGAIEWDRLVADERRRRDPDRPEAREKIRVVTRLNKRPREATADPKLEVWEAKHRELAELAWSGQAGRKQRRPPRSADHAEEDATPTLRLSSSIRPALSIPTRSLDALFLHLVEEEGRPPGFVGPTSTDTSDTTNAAALELAASLSRLRRKRSRRAIYRSFQLAVAAERLDLAADFWVDLLDQVRSSSAPPDHAGLRWLDKLLGRLVRRLRTEERSFAAAPTKPVMAAVATLTRALDQLWSSERRTAFGPVAGALVRTLATFPPAPFAGDFEPGSGLRRRARLHRKVYEMVQEVMRRVLEDLTRRDIHLGPVKSRLGLARPDRTVASSLMAAGLATSDFNTLVSYSLLKLQSPELAMLLLERMTERGLRPTAATQNIVFSALGGGTDLDTLERLLQTRKEDPRAVPVFLKHLAETASFDHLDAIVFRLLPELDHDVDEVDPFRSAVLPPVRPPDPTGRTPFLYTTLLYVLSCAGRIGLAERVFRNARWAAELSRSPSTSNLNGQDTPGWVLPPHAFTIMLQMYAGEVRRGRQLERRDARLRSAAEAEADETSPFDTAPPPPSTPFVRGWGRHALRVFLLQERRSRLQSELGDAPVTRTVSGLSAAVGGSTVSTDPAGGDSPPTRSSNRRLLDLPPFLRSEAAPIAAMWELEGGSKEPELKSLEQALKSPQAADALRFLFRAEGGELSAEEKLLDLRKRSWRNGYRAGQDSAKERVRRRSEALRRHALVREVAAEPR
jgi:hypothetical protein